MSKYTELFKSIKDILEKDSVLCNYFRYIDYGEFKKNNSDGRTCWNSVDDECINYNNLVNKTQCIRFVSKLDVKFLKNLKAYNSNTETGDINLYNKWSDPIKHFWNYINSQNYYYGNNENLNMELNKLVDRMFNLDCTFEIKGSSLTALDFVGKNARFTSTEAGWWNNFLFDNIKKLIFVGDKCFLLSIVDSYNSIWVSCKILQYMHENLSNEKFKEVILKLFSVFNRLIINNLKFSIPQFINDEIQILMLKKFIQSSNTMLLDCNEDNFVTIMDFDFSENEDINNYIKENIKDVIYKSVSDCISKNYKFNTFDMGDYLYSLRNMYNETIKKSNSIAFISGLHVYSIINDTGWTCVINVAQDEYYHQLNLDVSKQYIYKDVDIVPECAVISEYDNYEYFGKRIMGYRKIKDDYKSRLSDYAHIKRLYIELGSGTMLAVGDHPNVSSGHQVCMGDLKGKITFANTSKDELIEMIKSCEELLCTINYSSSYTDSGKRLFLSDDYSIEAFNDNENVTSIERKNSAELIKDVASISDDDFDEEDDQNLPQNIESDDFNEEGEQNLPQDFESDDFEESE